MNDSLKTAAWRTLVTVAIIIVIGACFYAEENSRGVAAWKKCEREIAARGESLNWDDYIPAPVPDEQNFYKAPMMSEWFGKSFGDNASISLSPRLANPETVSNVITEISASNYLAWSGTFEPDFDKIHDALKRPNARLVGDYVKTIERPMPNFVNYRIVTQILAHRAKCHLLLGEPEQALASLTLLHNLNQTLVKDGKPTTLVTAMIHVAITGLYADAVACGIEASAWRESDLVALQKQLAQINLLPELAHSFRVKRANTLHWIETFSTDELVRGIGRTPITRDSLGWWFMPSGWFYQNMTVISSLEQMHIESFDPASNTVSPYKAMAASRRIEDAFRNRTPYNFIAAVCIPNFAKATEQMARNQTWVDQALIACALERYRLANEKYPTDLVALVPQFLEKIPHDIITGKPMSYTRTDEQNFKLWSIGWNEVDDGGITAHTSDGKEDRDFGDWTWHYPVF